MRFVVDEVAWSNRWRDRAVADKLLLTVALLTICMTSPNWVGSSLVAVTATCVALVCAKVTARQWLQVIAAPLLFIATGAAATLVNIHFTAWPSLSLSPAVLERAIAAATRALGATSALLLFAMTTPASDTLGWLLKRGVPREVLEIANLMYRMVCVLVETVQRVYRAQCQRMGYANWRNSLRSAAHLGATLAVQAWSRAERLDRGLQSRGFSGGFPHSCRPLHHSRGFVALTVAGCATLAAVSWSPAAVTAVTAHRHGTAGHHTTLSQGGVR